MKILIVSSNSVFLDWINKFNHKLIQYDENWPLIKRGFFILTLKPKIKILSYFYDVIFCEWFGTLSKIITDASSKPVYIRLHRHEVHTYKKFKSINYKKIKAIVTVSNYYKSIVEEKTNNKVKVVTIQNGLNLNDFPFNPKINRPLKICTLSNLIHRKRIFDLIVNNPHLKIDIGGDGKEKYSLQHIIKRFNSKAKIYGRVELPKFYHDHDIFILNSSDESFGYSLVEAMSCGLIPLCFSWGGIEEVLPEWHIYKTYEDLNQKLERISNMTEDEITNIKLQMRQIVESKFTIELQAEKFHDLFTNVS